MTMKPNKFIVNTDYLSLAQIGKQELFFAVPAGTVPAGGQVVRDGDFTVTSQKGAIDQILIRQDDHNYRLGYSLSVVSGNDIIGTTDVYRTSASNMRVRVTINNLFSSSVLNYPAMTFRVKVSSFKPPNIF